jgi:hypothetical protein
VKFFGWVLALVAAGCSTAAAATLHVDTFNDDEQGWAGGGAITHEVLGGAGDGTGYIRVPNGGQGKLATFNSDARWKGDFTSLGAARVIVDLRVPVGEPELSMRLVLFGPNSNLTRYISADAQIVPADGVWRTYAFSLGSADFVPTQIEDPFISHGQIMANVLQVMLRHNTELNHGGSPVSGVLHVDNVELATAPALGDFDGNGLVNAADLSHPTLGWKERFGVDLDGNDFLDWQRGLNVPMAAAVAEPATLSAAIPLLAAILIRRRRGGGAPVARLAGRRLRRRAVCLRGVAQSVRSH